MAASCREQSVPPPLLYGTLLRARRDPLEIAALAEHEGWPLGEVLHAFQEHGVSAANRAVALANAGDDRVTEWVRHDSSAPAQLYDALTLIGAPRSRLIAIAQKNDWPLSGYVAWARGWGDSFANIAADLRARGAGFDDLTHAFRQNDAPLQERIALLAMATTDQTLLWAAAEEIPSARLWGLMWDANLPRRQMSALCASGAVSALTWHVETALAPRRRLPTDRERPARGTRRNGCDLAGVSPTATRRSSSACGSSTQRASPRSSTSTAATLAIRRSRAASGTRTLG